MPHDRGQWCTNPACFARELLPGCQFWCKSQDGDPPAFRLARRHYSAWKNKHPKLRQFVGPGHPLVLISPWEDALFVWRKSKRDDGQEGVCCCIFRNEGPCLASSMILEAERLAWAKWPGERLFTHVDPKRVNSQNPGYCFLMAGWTKTDTVTSRGLRVWEKLPAPMEAARPRLTRG